MLHQAEKIRNFEMVFKEYYGLLMQVSQYYLGNKEDAEEVVNEVFFKLWDSGQDIETAKLKSYLSIAVKNKSINVIRDRKRSVAAVDTDDIELASSSFSDEQIIYKQTSEQVSHAIESLPEQCRIIFNLHRQHHYTYSQIAELLEISNKTVENQIGKALKILRNLLKDTLLIFLLNKMTSEI